MKRPELMVPIKNFASLEACKNYADAVYFGLPEFSLRSRMADITSQNLEEFVDKCHSYNIKAYLTLNAAIYNNEIEALEALIKKIKKIVDAVIVWDIATIEICKEQKVPFFISTQANICNTKTAEFYRRIGAERVVLSREMNLEQIIEIKKNSGIKVEVFVHGAMCIAISGRCLLSNYFWGKSGNKGFCAQPCRKAWHLLDTNNNKLEIEENKNGTFFMNTKDLCMIEFIPLLMEAGIDSFKIEGRKRDPLYIETVSRCYNEAIESVLDKTFCDSKVERWKQEMSQVYTRGFSTGFYFSQPDSSGISYNQADNVSMIEKVLVGKVVHYYNNISVALIELKNSTLRVGENITIEDKNIFLRQKIEAMEINNQKIQSAKKGEEIGIKVNKPVRKGCNLFVYRKKSTS